MSICTVMYTEYRKYVKKDLIMYRVFDIHTHAFPETVSAKAAKNLGYDNHIGVVQAKDSFYGQHSPHRMPTEKHLCEQWEAWKRLGVLASEMESSTLYVVGASLGIKTGSVFLCVWNQERFAAGMDDSSNETHDTEKAIKTAVEAVRLLIKGESI